MPVPEARYCQKPWASARGNPLPHRVPEETHRDLLSTAPGAVGASMPQEIRPYYGPRLQRPLTVQPARIFTNSLSMWRESYNVATV